MSVTIADSMVEAVAEDYESDSRVENVEIKRNEKGPYLELTPTDRLAASDLRSDRTSKPVYIVIND